MKGRLTDLSWTNSKLQTERTAPSATGGAKAHSTRGWTAPAGPAPRTAPEARPQPAPAVLLPFPGARSHRPPEAQPPFYALLSRLKRKEQPTNGPGSPQLTRPRGRRGGASPARPRRFSGTRPAGAAANRARAAPPHPRRRRKVLEGAAASPQGAACRPRRCLARRQRLSGGSCRRASVIAPSRGQRGISGTAAAQVRSSRRPFGNSPLSLLVP